MVEMCTLRCFDFFFNQNNLNDPTCSRYTILWWFYSQAKNQKYIIWYQIYTSRYKQFTFFLHLLSATSYEMAIEKKQQTIQSTISFDKKIWKLKYKWSLQFFLFLKCVKLLFFRRYVRLVRADERTIETLIPYLKPEKQFILYICMQL